MTKYLYVIICPLISIFLFSFFPLYEVHGETKSNLIFSGDNDQMEFHRSGYALALNYPGLGIKVCVSQSILLEGKYQFDQDIAMIGLRLCNYFNSISKFQTFFGIELNNISFKGEKSEGAGYSGELLAGCEIYLSKRFSLQLDLGPSYIVLKDKTSSISVDGLEYISNVGVNIYFGKLKHEIIKVFFTDIKGSSC